MNSLLSLTWNNHGTALLRKLENLFIRDSYADATISCHGKYFPVHRLVLSTCSEYFEEIFEKTQCKHPFIIVQDIDAMILEALLNYMYKGNVNVLQDVLPELIKAAESLKIKGLAVSADPMEDEVIYDKKRSLSVSSTVPLHKKVKRKEERHISNCSDKPCNDQVTLLERNDSPLMDIQDSKSTKPNNNYEAEYVNCVKQESLDESDNATEVIQVPSPIPKIKNIDASSDISGHQFGIHISELSQNVDELNMLSDNSIDSSRISGMEHYKATRTNEEQRITIAPLISLQEPNPKEQFHTERPNLYKCKWQHCIFVAHNENEFKVHTMAKHSGGKPHSCSFCDFQAETSHDLRIHLYRHIGGSGFSCQLCPYSADCFSNLEKHIRVHTKEKPYCCPHCPYRTAQSSNLYKHIFSKHK